MTPCAWTYGFGVDCTTGMWAKGSTNMLMVLRCLLGLRVLE